MKKLLLGSMVLLAFAQVAADEPTCHYIQVTDSCLDRLWVYKKASDSDDLDFVRTMNLGGYGEPSGVAVSTVPGSFHSFVTHGSMLQVVLFTNTMSPPVLYTRDVAALSGISGLQLQKVFAAQPVMAYPTSGPPALQYALYVVGHAYSGGQWHPYLVVMDQENLINGEWAPAKLVKGTAPLCDGSTCDGVALDIAVSGGKVEDPQLAPDADTQFAFASVLLEEGTPGDRRLAFVSITRTQRPRGPWSTSIDPNNIEPVLWDPIAPRIGGVAFDTDGESAYGVFQSSKTFAQIGGGPACSLTYPYPLDVAVHGPTGALGDSIGFVSYQDGAEGHVVAIPGACPGTSEFLGDDVEIVSDPIALGIGPKSDAGEVTVYAISRLSNTIAYVAGDIDYPDGETRVTFGTVFPTLMDDPVHGVGCPTAIAIGGEIGCIDPNPTGVDPKCIGDNDPACPPEPPQPPRLP